MRENERYIDKYEQGALPDPDLSISEWADQYRYLSTKSSAEPGLWVTDRTPYLKEIMDCLSTDHPAEKIVFMKGSQIGGPLSLDTKIPTPSGFTTIDKIKVGDIVFDENGKEQAVLDISKKFKDEDCYKITFDDGSIVKCDWRHLWTLERDNFKGSFKVETKKTIDLLNDYKKGNRNRYRLKIINNIETSKKELPIGAYTLGAWLGDGNRNYNRITTHIDDAYIIAEKIKNEGHRINVVKEEKRYDSIRSIIIDPICNTTHCMRGHDLSIVGKTTSGRCAQCHRERCYYNQYKKKKPKKAYKFGTLLRNLNLYKNKHIPNIYLRSSKKQRFDLLQGLMDTDGYCSKNGLCEFYSVDKNLSTQVMHLACSLGIKARLIKKEPNQNSTFKSINNVWVVRFTAYSNKKIFNLSRKQSRLKLNGKISKINYRRIISIKKIKSFETKCISVNSRNNLFLISDNFISTHNTEAGNNWIGYIIDQTPAPTLIVFPTVDLAKRHSKTRLDPLIDESPALSSKISPVKSRDSGNTILMKDFYGGVLVLTGANSSVGLKSMPVRFLFMDEVDGYPDDAAGEGDPVDLAIQRTATFSNKKILMISSPTIKNFSRIEQAFLEGDQRYYQVPCPDCNKYQKLVWKNIKFDSKNFKEAVYACEYCGSIWENHQKTEILSKGKWVAENPKADNKIVSFHLSSLYSPHGWSSWTDISKEFLNVKNDPPRLQVWTNTKLAETWQDQSGETIDPTGLMARREKFGNLLPAGVSIITAGVDVQDNRLEVEIVGWGKDEESWSLDYKVIYGDPSTPGLWSELDEILQWTFQHSKQIFDLSILAVSVDSGGHYTDTVLSFCQERSQRRIWAIKGSSSGYGVPIFPMKASQSYKKKQPLYIIGVNDAKETIMQRLRINNSGAGCCHFPADRESWWFDQLTGEIVKTKLVKGRPVREWTPKKTTQKVEALDCRVYAFAALRGLMRNWKLDLNGAAEYVNNTEFKKEQDNLQKDVENKIRKEDNIVSKPQKVIPRSRVRSKGIKL